MDDKTITETWSQSKRYFTGIIMEGGSSFPLVDLISWTMFVRVSLIINERGYVGKNNFYEDKSLLNSTFYINLQNCFYL